MSDKLRNGPISNAEEVEASTEDVVKLKELDTLLKCSICYDYFSTCVMTDCSHNFCSLCIRKYIQYKRECPVCFSELYDSQLRANRIVDSFVSSLPTLKERVIRHLRTLKVLSKNEVYTISPSKNAETPSFKSSANGSEPLTDASSSVMKCEDHRTPVACTSSRITAAPSSSATTSQSKILIPKMFQSPVKKSVVTVAENPEQKLVNCPVCAVDIPERNINLHLDDCLKRDKHERKRTPEVKKRLPLPKTVFHLMNINSIRAKVKEYGLNPQGDFEILKSRLQRYTTLYNAECDKSDPRPVQEIIRQLEKEEKTLSCQKLPKSIFAQSRENPVKKEELNEQYLKENKESFNKLIENMRRRNEKKCSNSVELSAAADSGNEIDYPDFCQPSTSKSSSFSTFVDCGDDPLRDSIDIQQMSVEDIKGEPINIDKKEPSIEVEKDNEEIKKEDDDDDDIAFSMIKRSRRKSKRNLFDQFGESKPAVTNAEVHSDGIETDDNISLVNDPDAVIEVVDEDEDSEDEVFSSPIIKKTRKRKCNKANNPQRGGRKRRR